MSSRSRLMRELKDCAHVDGEEVLYLGPDSIDCLSKWTGVISGPAHSPCYSGGRFVIGIECDSNYPFQAPRIWFKTKVFLKKSLYEKF